MIRIIADGPAGFKSINDLGRDPWNVPLEEVISGDPELRAIYDPDKTWDIATLAIASEYRASRSTEGAQTSLALFHCLCREAIANGKECGVTVLDDIVLNQVIQPLGHAFERYADPRLGSREYLDSPGSTPMYCDFLDFRDRVRREQPDVFAALFEGRGIEDFADIPLSKPVDSGAQVNPSPALSGLAGSLVDEPNGWAPSSTEAEGRATWENSLHKRHGPYFGTKTAPTGVTFDRNSDNHMRACCCCPPRHAQLPGPHRSDCPCLLYTSPSPRDRTRSRMPSSA